MPRVLRTTLRRGGFEKASTGRSAPAFQSLGIHIRTFFAINISFIPTVIQYLGIAPKFPPTFINPLIVRVSRDTSNTRV